MFCMKRPVDAGKRQSKEIDVRLKEIYKKESEIIKLLLLGTGESGKTTIIKQMKILHINGFSETEKIEKIPSIKQNVHDSIYAIVSNMDALDPPITLKNNESVASKIYILDIGQETPQEYSKEYFDHVNILWKDPGVRETYARSNEYQLIDSAEHFLDRIDDIRQSDYIPTVQDILFCRVETEAISKIEFNVKVPKMYGGGVANFWMYDVGGQKGHRKKWISVFDGIHAILFLIAASDFDQTLREDHKTNRLQESFTIFRDIFWSRYVREAGMIVFLNKQDLLQKKIENGKKIEKYFPEFANYTVPEKYKSENNKYEKAKHYMKQKILDISKNKPEPELIAMMPGVYVKETVDDRDVYIHYTIATDTNNIKLVFDDVHSLIIKININKIYSQ